MLRYISPRGLAFNTTVSEWLWYYILGNPGMTETSYRTGDFLAEMTGSGHEGGRDYLVV